jgi:enoyl-CoA hydratase/carnithine racemase
MTDAEILCDIRQHVAIITLNRPAALNALSLGMLVELRARLRRCAEDSDVHAVLLRGAGDKAFCAGGDIRALYRSFKESGSLHRAFFVAEYTLDYLLYSYPKPYVVLLDGIAMGGGMGLAQGSTLRIAGERTRMAMPEVSIGLFPDVGASYFLSRLRGSLGTYLALTGVQLHGADAVYAGLADVYLAPAAIAALPDDLAALDWPDDRGAWHEVVRRLLDGRSLAPERIPASPGQTSLSMLQPAIDAHFSHSSVSAVLDSLDGENRADLAPWGRRTAALIRSRSPTLLSVTLQQLARGKSLDLAGCFRMELGMVQQCFEQGDFIEGVRALLIDKDNAPHWAPARLEDVTEESVRAFFQNRWGGAQHPLDNIESESLTAGDRS